MMPPSQGPRPRRRRDQSSPSSDGELFELTPEQLEAAREESARVITAGLERALAELAADASDAGDGDD